MFTFYRKNFSEIWIRIISNETLGLLDSSFVQDYDGIDGQVTLRNLDSGQKYTVLVSEAVEETPEKPHDILVGFYSLASLPDGNYEVQGRVRDKAGNYSIVGNFHDSTVIVNRLAYDFRIEAGTGEDIDLGLILMVSGYTFTIGYLPPQNTSILKFNDNLNINWATVIFDSADISIKTRYQEGINMTMGMSQNVTIKMPLKGDDFIINLPLKDI